MLLIPRPQHLLKKASSAKEDQPKRGSFCSERCGYFAGNHEYHRYPTETRRKLAFHRRISYIDAQRAISNAETLDTSDVTELALGGSLN
jgi:hypothetical protein